MAPWAGGRTGGAAAFESAAAAQLAAGMALSAMALPLLLALLHNLPAALLAAVLSLA